MRILAPLFFLSVACSATPAAKPEYTDVDSLPKVIAPTSASVAPVVKEPVIEKPVEGRARAEIASAAQAVAQFQAAWTEEVIPASKGRTRPEVGQYSAAVGEMKRLSARKMECRAGHRRVDNTLGGNERRDLVFFGAIPVLDRDGECWEVTVSTGAFNEILGYFDPGTGALLMVWLVPEG